MGAHRELQEEIVTSFIMNIFSMVSSWPNTCARSLRTQAYQQQGPKLTNSFTHRASSNREVYVHTVTRALLQFLASGSGGLGGVDDTRAPTSQPDRTPRSGCDGSQHNRAIWPCNVSIETSISPEMQGSLSATASTVTDASVTRPRGPRRCWNGCTILG